MRRRLLIVAIFLLAGAVVNVAVAWGCALSFRYSKAGSAPRSVWAYVREVEPDGSVAVAARAPLDQHWNIWAIHRSKDRGVVRYYSLWDVRNYTQFGIFATLRPEELAPSWAHLRTPPKADDAIRWVQAFGWPVVSMWRDYGGGDGNMYELRNGLRVTSLPPDGVFAQAVPFHPIWPGFAINTLFYPTVLWLLIPGPFALRRFIRVRRGLCPACAYPMGHSDACSECGKPLPRRMTVTT